MSAGQAEVSKQSSDLQEFEPYACWLTVQYTNLLTVTYTIIM